MAMIRRAPPEERRGGSCYDSYRAGNLVSKFHPRGPMRDRLKSDECSKYLRALADGDRLKIVQCLQDGPMSVGEVTRRLAARMANVSHHLRLLRQAGVVERRKQGRFVIYALSPKIHRPTPPGA